MEPTAISSPKDFAENTMFYINQEFAIVKNGKSQRRGKVIDLPLINMYLMLILKYLLSAAESYWSPAAEHGTFATGG